MFYHVEKYFALKFDNQITNYKSHKTIYKFKTTIETSFFSITSDLRTLVCYDSQLKIL